MTLQKELEAAAGYLASNPWRGKQNNFKDVQTDKIVYGGETSFQQVAEKLKDRLHDHTLVSYGIRRWYNYTVSEEVKKMFLKRDFVTPHPNVKNKKIDLYIHEIPFDVKGTVLPVSFCYDEAFPGDSNRERNLIQWLYNNQSTGRRYHLANRLFLVYHSNSGDDNSLKANLELTEKAVLAYLDTFEGSKLYQIEEARSDLIWVIG